MQKPRKFSRHFLDFRNWWVKSKNDGSKYWWVTLICTDFYVEDKIHWEKYVTDPPVPESYLFLLDFQFTNAKSVGNFE